MYSLGLSKFHANIVNTVGISAFMLFQLPTGAFADHFGRRTALLVGVILEALAYGGILFSHTFWSITLLIGLSGTGSAFISGSAEAWLVDRLKAERADSEIPGIFGTSAQIGSVSTIAGGLLGGLIGAHSLRMSFLPSLVVAAAAVPIIWTTFPETPRARLLHSGIVASLNLSTMRNCATFIRSHKHLQDFLVMNILLAFAFQALNVFWAPFLKDVFGSVAALGWVWCCVGAARLIGASVFKRSHSRAYAHNCFVFFPLLCLCSILSMATLHNASAVLISFLLFELGRAGFAPARRSTLNEFISGDKRATLVSMASLLYRLGGIASLLITGALADRVGIRTTFIFSAGVVLLSIPIALNLRRTLSASEHHSAPPSLTAS